MYIVVLEIFEGRGRPFPTFSKIFLNSHPSYLVEILEKDGWRPEGLNTVHPREFTKMVKRVITPIVHGQPIRYRWFKARAVITTHSRENTTTLNRLPSALKQFVDKGF